MQGPGVSIGGDAVRDLSEPGPKCAAGGTLEKQKGCVQIALPMTATLGGRYKFLDANGEQKGDIELDATWEHWGKTCDFIADPDCHAPGEFRVVVDAMAVTAATSTKASSSRTTSSSTACATRSVSASAAATTSRSATTS